MTNRRAYDQSLRDKLSDCRTTAATDAITREVAETALIGEFGSDGASTSINAILVIHAAATNRNHQALVASTHCWAEVAA